MHSDEIKTHLEYAAAAVGADRGPYGGYLLNGEPWFPLDDGADALKLATLLGMEVNVDLVENQTVATVGRYEVVVSHEDHNSYDATKRAIVFAAAMVGRAHQSADTPIDRYLDVVKTHLRAKMVLNALSEMYGMPVYSFDLDHRIIEDIGGDELDIIELVMMLEDEFNMIIPDEEAEQVKTVGDLVDLVEVRLK